MVTNVGRQGPDTGFLTPVHRMTLSGYNETAPVIVYRYRIPVSGYYYGHHPSPVLRTKTPEIKWVCQYLTFPLKRTGPKQIKWKKTGRCGITTK